MILAIGMIAVMFAVAAVVPLTQDDAAAPKELTSSPFVLSVDDEEHEVVEIPSEITTDFTIEAGQCGDLNKEVTISPGKHIIVKEGGELCIDIFKSFTLNGGAGSGIIFEEGSALCIHAMDVEIGDIPAYEDVDLDINGQIKQTASYDIPNLKASTATEIKDGTVISSEGVDFTFKGAAKFSMEATVFGSHEVIGKLMDILENEKYDELVDFLKTADIRAAASVSVETGQIVATNKDYPGEEYKFDKISVAESFEIASPANIKQDYVQIKVTDKTDISMSGAGANVTIKDDSNITLMIDDFTTKELEEFFFNIDGKFDFSVEAKDIDSGDDVKIGDMKLSLNGSFGDVWKYSESLKIDNFEAPIETEEQKGKLKIEGFEVSTESSIDFKSLPELFTYENIEKVVMYLISGYDPKNTDAYIEAVIVDLFDVYFKDENVKAALMMALSMIPEEERNYLGMACGFFATQKTVKFPAIYQDVYDKMPGDKKELSEYLELCGQELMLQTFGIEDFEMPTFTYTADLDLEGVFYESVNGTADIENVTFDFEVKEDHGLEISAAFDFGNADARFATLIGGGYDEVKIPAIKGSATFKGDSASVVGEVNGDLLIDVGDYYYALDGLKVSEEASLTINEATSKHTVEISGLNGRIHDDETDKERIITGNGIEYDGEGKLAIPDVTAQDILALWYALSEIQPPEDMDDPFDVLAFLDAVEETICSTLHVGPETITMLETEKFDVDFIDYTHIGSLSQGTRYIQYSDVSIDGAFGIDKGVEKCDLTADISGNHSVVRPGHGHASEADAKLTMKLVNNNEIDVELTGDFMLQRLHRSTPVYEFEMTDADVNAKIVKTDDGMDILPGKTSGKYTVVEHGVKIEFSEVKYTPETDVLYAESAKVSGYNNGTGIGNSHYPIKSIDGTIKAIKVDMKEFVPKFSIDSADLTFVGYNGATLKYTAEVDRGVTLNETYVITDGIFDYGAMADFAIIDRLIDPDGIDLYQAEVKGEGGHLITSELEMEDNKYFTGIVYVTDKYVNGDVELEISFDGALFGVMHNDGALKDVYLIRPMPGYTLDPSSYDGFTANPLDGIITIDEGADVLSATSIGEKYTLTLDGAPFEVTYGEPFTHEYRGENPAMVLGPNDRAYGHIEAGRWYLDEYHILGDATFTTVYGEEVQVKLNDVTEVTTKGFTFNVPDEEFDYIAINAPCGATIAYSAIDIAGKDAVYGCIYEVDKIKGNKTYQIDSSAVSMVTIPVSTKDAKLFHMVGGEATQMDAIVYEGDDGKYYATAYLSGYSLYYVEEGSSNGGDNTMLYVAIAVIAVVVLVAVAFAVKKRNGGESA